MPVSLPPSLTEASVVAVIPARYESTRLPGKPLADIAGRPMVEHVYRRARAARRLDAVLVATDSERIAEVVRGFGGVAVMTRSDHATGTDRLAEVASQLPCRVIVNVQGDEPLLEPAAIDAAVAPLLQDDAMNISTLARPIRDAAEFANPNVVKVTIDLQGRALYFSRAPIPHARGGWDALRSGADDRPLALAHIGLYAYRRDVLLRLAALSPTPLEQVERLEQLRALEHGIAIHVTLTDHGSPGVDTLEDLERVRQHLMLSARA